ncbi:hypothetical protein [Rhodococcus erythropolis]|uniref:hypothetical protein n=1 Tax=Rhodococcus erythropolis TaxID=1833 RepID=UPI003981ECF7
MRELASTDPATRTRHEKGSAPSAQPKGFLASFSRISLRFRLPRRHRMTATDHRTELAARFQVWNQVTEQTSAA